MATDAIDHPGWCDPEECDAGAGRGSHQAKVLTVPYHDRSRCSVSVAVVQALGQANTWICIDSRTVDLLHVPDEYTLLLTPEQARALGQHLVSASGRTASEASGAR